VTNYETILVEREGKVAKITLNRPEKLNAVNLQMFEELIKAIGEVEEDDDVNAVILKGNGTSFSAGADLEMVYFIYEGGTGKSNERRPSQRARLHRDRSLLETCRRLLYCWKPTIAQVHGYCIGVGLYLVQACDLAIAAENAKIGHPEQRLAFAGATFMLVNEILQVGPKKAREMLLTGKLIDGREAERIGYVNNAVPYEQLESEVATLAEAISLLPRDAIAVGKAQTSLAYDALGIAANINQAYIGHTLATNIRFEEDEYNFLRERRNKGAREAFHERDERWEKFGL
jgi:enoyl-CoA hydratase